MTQIPDLIELSGIGSNATYTTGPGGGGDILGIVDNATYTGDDDNSAGQITELNDTASDGGILTIDGVAYNIEIAVPDSSLDPVTVTTGGPGAGSFDLTGDGFSTEIVFIQAIPTGGGATRYFALMDDSAGDVTNIASIQTRDLDFSPAGNDVQIDAEQNNTVTICFASGSLIATPTGSRPVEDLRPSDLVLTKDEGPLPIQWVGGRRLSAWELTRRENLRPIRLEPSALGEGYPSQPLTLSPQHRVLLSSPIAGRMFGSTECLVPVVKLLDLPGVERLPHPRGVHYHHILLDGHQIVFANDLPCETLLMGPIAQQALSAEALEEIRQILPQAKGLCPAAPVRPLVTNNHKIKRLLARLQRNGRPFLETAADPPPTPTKP